MVYIVRAYVFMARNIKAARTQSLHVFAVSCLLTLILITFGVNVFTSDASLLTKEI